MSGSEFETRSVIKKCSTVQDGWTADPSTQRGGGMGTVEKWQRKSVGSLFEVQLGKMLNKAAKEKTPQYPYLTNINVRWGAFDISQLNTMFFSDREKRKFELRGGDILVCEGGEVGRCAVWDDSLTPCYFQKALHRLRPKGPILPTYFQAYMEYISGTKILADFTSRTSITHLTREKLIELPILLPSLPEQRKIAEILRTWDEAIERLETLNDRLERRNASICRRIFESDYTANNRLLRTREVFEVVSERKRTELPLLAVMQDIGIVRREELDRRVVMPEGDISSYKVIRPGDFVISLRSFEGGLEYSSMTGLVSPAYTVLRPSREIESLYYRHFFKSRSFIRRLDKLIFGIRDGKQIAFRDFGHMFIPHPLMLDQRKRARLLDAAAEMVVANKRQKKALECQKRGLMQKLLTGEWRVTP